jgi:predicted phosphodiesterase
MKLWILSDLHLEYDSAFGLTYPDSDVCILAGDIHSPLESSVRWAAENIAPRMPVILVPGNHEFYGTSVEGGLQRGVEAAKEFPNLHLLVDEALVIDGVRFLGSILWTDYALHAASHRGKQRDEDVSYSMRFADEFLWDHSAIALHDDQSERWRPQHVRPAHIKARSFLERELAEGHAGTTVVVTHYAPHPYSVAVRFIEDGMTPAFVSDLSDLINDFQPDLWIHGHVHDSFSYEVGKTRVVCNPRGYADENGVEFDPALVVEVKS